MARAKALRDNSVLPGVDPHSFLMPPRIEAALYLVADHDPVDDSLVTLGYLYVEGDQVREHIEVLPTADRRAEADALVRVFNQIIADLVAVDTRNAASSPGGIHAHIILYEATEAIALQNAVKRHLDDPRVRGGLLHMVRLFPPDDVVPEPEFRGMQHLPATALRTVVEQLFALPVTVSHDLRQVSAALASDGLISEPYLPDPAFERPFSSLLAIEVSRGLRERRRGSPDSDAVRADVAARMRATRAVAEWLQAEHKRRTEAGGLPMLRLNKLPFRLQATFDPLAAGDIDVLRAFELLENRSGLLDTLIRLAQPTRVRRDAGRAVGPMRILSATPKQRDALLIFAVPPEAQDAEVAAGAFGLILSDGEPDLVLEPRLWPQLACTLRDPRFEDAANIIRISVHRRVFDGVPFQDLMRRAGQDRWWLDQTFIDLNAAKADAYLSFLAAEDVA
ncbi:hypothetical protein NKH63_28620 [Mesorhizobium sp. M0960]|uniref:hypothetical protein n=1 Tax=Mesorhizobium sp. M0960 TaxID=2957035 RepID=UPI003334BC08